MKKLITLFLMLVCVLSYAASPGKIIRVPNATTAFNEDVSIGNLIVNTATGEVFIAKLGMASTVTLTTAIINVDIQNINGNIALWNTAYSNMGKCSVGGVYGSLSSYWFTNSSGDVSISMSPSIGGDPRPVSASTISTALSGKQNTLTRASLEAIIPIVPEYNTTLNTNIDSNLKNSVSANATITIQNLTEGRTGNIEISYFGAAVVTFNVGSANTLYIASSIYNTTTNAYTKSVLSQSTGTAVYSYYMSGTNVYLTGTQEWD